MIIIKSKDWNLYPKYQKTLILTVYIIALYFLYDLQWKLVLKDKTHVLISFHYQLINNINDTKSIWFQIKKDKKEP